MQNNISVIFGKRLSVLRVEREFTQKQMAEKLQVSVSTYANWEQGRREPDIEHLIMLAEILEIDMNSLFEL